MNQELLTHYRKQRQHLPAQSALIQARYDLKGDAIKKEFSKMEAEGLVRFLVEEDDSHYSIEELEGEAFNPKAHPSINPNQLKKQQKEFRQRVADEGVWGIVTEYRTTRGWEHAASVWEFVGEDWRDSDYVMCVMRSAIDAYNAQVHCVLCHQSIK